MCIYYIYAYLRKDGTPYYIGKGSSRRAWTKHKGIAVPTEKSRIIIMETNLSNSRKTENRKTQRKEPNVR